MISLNVDQKTLDDLVEFCKLEIEACDIEPWAEVIRALALEPEAALWLVKLYNAYDDISSAWKLAIEWQTPQQWLAGADREKVAQYFISRERRNLYGGKIIKHLDSYSSLLGPKSQMQWFSEAEWAEEGKAFYALKDHVQQVWGTGRQSAFEWLEFLVKCLGAKIPTEEALLWESSGPRESLERLYGNDHPTKEWLDYAAMECKSYLESKGVALSWWDFETVICDFNVARKGRYAPGKHLAMIREEIMSLEEPHRSRLRSAFDAVTPVKWREAPVDKAVWALYRDQGVLWKP